VTLVIPEVDTSLMRRPPFPHQVVGVRALAAWSEPAAGRHLGGCFMLADEMGAGKTKQAIDAVQVVASYRDVERVIVVAPAAVRGVWLDPEFGELTKHLWADRPALVGQYHRRSHHWYWVRGQVWPDGNKVAANMARGALTWMVTNYEFLRDESALLTLCQWASEAKTWLLLDESSYVKTHNAIQTRACFALRTHCRRVTLLNGTPVDNSPLDLYAQFAIMDPRIMGCKTFYHYRNRYAIMGGYLKKQVLEWRNLDDLQGRATPYVLRRLKRDCIDLPERLEPVTLEARLEPRTWSLYRQMRDDMVAELEAGDISVAAQAGVRVLRLAQLCSGFLGGVRPEDDPGVDPEVREVGAEKANLLLQWVRDRLDEDPDLKLVIWCRFRPELARVRQAMLSLGRPQVGVLWGMQGVDERRDALHLLKPETAPQGPVIVIGITAVGSMGVDLSASHTVVYLSNGTSLRHRLQADDRVHRPPQKNVCSYYDVVASGPDGQRTVDHVLIRAMRAKESLANWTTSAWVQALREE